MPVKWACSTFKTSREIFQQLQFILRWVDFFPNLTPTLANLSISNLHPTLCTIIGAWMMSWVCGLILSQIDPHCQQL